jgi:hypothetical protein
MLTRSTSRSIATQSSTTAAEYDGPFDGLDEGDVDSSSSSSTTFGGEGDNDDDGTYTSSDTRSSADRKSPFGREGAAAGADEGATTEERAGDLHMGHEGSSFLDDDVFHQPFMHSL